MDDTPLRYALEQTLVGLRDAMPLTDPGYDEGLVGDDTRYEHLHWMVEQSLAHLQEWPTDKTSRWIGFIQGVLTMRGVMDTDKERDRTRPFFHAAYEAMGFGKPKTIERIESDGPIEGHQIIDDIQQGS